MIPKWVTMRESSMTFASTTVRSQATKSIRSITKAAGESATWRCWSRMEKTGGLQARTRTSDSIQRQVYLFDSATTNTNSIATFTGVPAGEGYYYLVDYVSTHSVSCRNSAILGTTKRHLYHGRTDHKRHLHPQYAVRHSLFMRTIVSPTRTSPQSRYGRGLHSASISQPRTPVIRTPKRRA